MYLTVFSLGGIGSRLVLYYGFVFRVLSVPFMALGDDTILTTDGRIQIVGWIGYGQFEF